MLVLSVIILPHLLHTTSVYALLIISRDGLLKVLRIILSLYLQGVLTYTPRLVSVNYQGTSFFLE